MILAYGRSRVRCFAAATTMLLASCNKPDAPADSGSSTAAGSGSTMAMALAEKPYEDIGEAGTGSNNRCYVDDGGVRRPCEGYPEVDLFASSPDNSSILKWIGKRGWQPSSPLTARQPETGNVVQVMRIEAIQYPEKMRLKELARRGMVIAKIVADPNGPADRRYGIGGRYTQGGFDTLFFLVLDKYDATDLTEKEDSRKIGQWHVFGILKATSTAKAKWVKLERSGPFRYCREKHLSPAYDAGFYSCPPAHQLDLIQQLPEVQERLGNYPIVSAVLRLLELQKPDSLQRSAYPISRELFDATLNQVLGKATLLTDAHRNLVFTAVQNRFEAPAWIMCGAGCCTADEVL